MAADWLYIHYFFFFISNQILEYPKTTTRHEVIKSVGKEITSMSIVRNIRTTTTAFRKHDLASFSNPYFSETVVHTIIRFFSEIRVPGHAFETLKQGVKTANRI